jgi:hypothetical protein
MSMTPPTPAPTPAPTPQPCPVCGQVGTLRSQQTEHITKTRVKFGVFWVLISLLSLGVGFVLWLVWPRSKRVTGVDRWLECGSCHARI